MFALNQLPAAGDGAPSIGARLDENFIFLFFSYYMTEAPVGFVEALVVGLMEAEAEVPLAGFARFLWQGL